MPPAIVTLTIGLAIVAVCWAHGATNRRRMWTQVAGILRTGAR